MLKFIALFAIMTVTLGFAGRASGCHERRDNKLLLSFASPPQMISDGYKGTGRIEAEAVPSALKP